MSLLQRTVCLLVLLSLPSCADGMSPYDPRLCYILDGFLVVYGLIITTLYLKEKFFTSKTKTDKEDTEDHYAKLKPTADDKYQELPLKRERQRKNDHRVYEGLNRGTTDTYHTLQMQPVPPPHR